MNKNNDAESNKKNKKTNTNESIGLGPATFPHMYFSSDFYIKICDKIMSFKICLVKRTNKITPIIQNLQGKRGPGSERSFFLISIFFAYCYTLELIDLRD